jgi:hypothetical protein
MTALLKAIFENGVLTSSSMSQEFMAIGIFQYLQLLLRYDNISIKKSCKFHATVLPGNKFRLDLSKIFHSYVFKEKKKSLARVLLTNSDFQRNSYTKFFLCCNDRLLFRK